MQRISYTICNKVNIGNEEYPHYIETFFGKDIPYSEYNLEIAKKEAHEGNYEIYDDGESEYGEPTRLDVVEAQVAYTAIMTDTLLEG